MAGAVLVQLLSGLTSAAILFLVAAGITLIFGAMRIINVAHGSLYMYGAFVMASLLSSVFSGAGLFWLALVLSTLLTGLLGVALEITVLRRIYAREHLAQLLATFALFYILADLAQEIWGNKYRTVAVPPLLAGHITLLGNAFPVYSLFVIGVAVLVGLALFALLSLTLFGWRVRAAADDPELLAATGANVKLLSTGLFGLGAVLAGLAGAVVAPLQAVTSGMDASILVAAFIVSIIGGLGSVLGSAFGAVIIGVFQAFGVIWLPQWSSTFVYVAMILLLAFRPSGLLGQAE
ncbi:MAG: branched-chain amino acid ABC transporter permease [Acetobacteraceae bacterium]